MSRSPKQLFVSAARSRTVAGFVRFFGCALTALSLLALNGAQAQATTYVVGTTNLLVGPSAGINSVMLGVTPQTGGWTARANDAWLSLTPANQSGIGNMHIVFSYEANPGATRSGTLTIADQTITVTQAGSTYVPVPGSTVPLVSSGLSSPWSVAVDASGNLYISDIYNQAIFKWTATSNTVTTLVSSGLSYPSGVAVDAAGDVYIADSNDATIKKWIASNNSVITLVSSGLGYPMGIAVDASGNVYIADTYDNAIKLWIATNNTLTTLVSFQSDGWYLDTPLDVALDCAGNVYIANTYNAEVDEWNAVTASVTELYSLGRNSIPWDSSLTVDGSGNIYFSVWDFATNFTYPEWIAANNTVTELIAPALDNPTGVAVDAAGNIYVVDYAIYELPHAFVDPTTKLEGPVGGNDFLPSIVPTTQNLLPPLSPTSDQSWLTITGISNSVVRFSFATNSGPDRKANIMLLGETIPIFQFSPPNFLNTTTPSNGVFQFAFSNFQNSSFTVVSTTNVFLPMTNWTVIGTASNIAPNLFQFTDTNPATDSQRFYRARSP